ncbi:MAG TPA: MBL fold metallo-hydrolase [Candidatus Microsaccharimonas sp.]|nr:MBL fold metallo-hydrolase [Candidatus Microsaccharimonas sp.]
MDLQFYGANCVVLTYKGTRVVIDDVPAAYGSKSVLRAGDLALFSGTHDTVKTEVKLLVDAPGEYEVGDVSVHGVAAQAHVDEKGTKNATMFKVTAGDMHVLFAGNIDPNVSEAQLEALGKVDVLVVPVGGNGLTLDPIGALKVIKEVEPKMVIPVHYADKALNFPMPQQELDIAIREMSMEPKERVAKLKLKPSDFGDTMQLVVLEKS